MTDIFSPEALQKQIDKAITRIPEDHHHIVVGYWTVDGRWRVTYAMKINDSWRFGANFEKDREKGISGGIVIQGSW